MSRGARLLRSVIVLVLVVGGGYFAVAAFDDDGEDGRGRTGRPPAGEDRTFESNDPIERACALDKPLLARVWRGFDPERSEDVTFVPLAPNYSGAFDVTSHSGPWDYLQNVPLVLYGPGVIEDAGRVKGAATLADVFSTAGALTGVDLPERAGRVLEEAVGEAGAPPKLIVTIM
ncbi:MAG TPA: hypothetical protein VEU29_04815, partial [Actinomycetota bacterium]|nr:hypothetical protein [Actinomycetota bacterium]